MAVGGFKAGDAAGLMFPLGSAKGLSRANLSGILAIAESNGYADVAKAVKHLANLCEKYEKAKAAKAEFTSGGRGVPGSGVGEFPKTGRLAILSASLICIALMPRKLNVAAFCPAGGSTYQASSSAGVWGRPSGGNRFAFVE